MTRPSVFIATLDPLMARALRKRLKPLCDELDLKLDVCPGGEGRAAQGETGYASATNLFDVLEARDPDSLADTLVVMDVGVDVSSAFGARSQQDGWRNNENSPGVAVEMLLRFPLVFPVFVSAALPPRDEWLVGRTGWTKFREVVKALLLGAGPQMPKLTLHTNQCPAFDPGLHLISLHNGTKEWNGKATLERFASGMRCWFDPTGLRTLVRNRQLGMTFGSSTDWSSSWPRNPADDGLRKALLDRLDRIVVAVDEEREFSALLAYAAYKYGYRSWMVTSWSTFKDRLWGRRFNAQTMLVLRDVDLRFPDYPKGEDVGCKGLRGELMSATSEHWKPVRSARVRTRSVTSVALPSTVPSWYERLINRWKPEEISLGERTNVCQNNERQYLGLQKPLSSVYDLCKLHQLKSRSLTSQLGNARSADTTSHAAPYANLAIAESLLKQAGRCSGQPVSQLLAALMAGESYSLLLGMSKTTALEALMAMHRAEVHAEITFLGISGKVGVNERKRDIEASLNSLLGCEQGARMVGNIYLSQFWAELRGIYRDGERFKAAEGANRESLLSSRWLFGWFSGALGWPSWTRWFNPKRWIVGVGTILRSWLGAATVMITLVSGAYAYVLPQPLCGDTWDLVCFMGVARESMLTSLSLQLTECLDDAMRSNGSWGGVLAITHLSFSYIMFGLLISMLYRKLTRA